ncbi:MAG TPA: hypothetical protein P5056_01795 [Candidatus Paceibacterota bacterium]|nr:hypothetical protein [Candidatus Paceibacterota bacterium]
MEKVDDNKVLIHEVDGRQNGPVITLTTDPERVQMLWRKLKILTNRLDHSRNSETQWNTVYEIEILDTLLNKGSVNTWDLSRKLADAYGSIDCRTFSFACGVIQSYNDYGGTGLK